MVVVSPCVFDTLTTSRASSICPLTGFALVNVKFGGTVYPVPVNVDVPDAGSTVTPLGRPCHCQFSVGTLNPLTGKKLAPNTPFPAGGTSTQAKAANAKSPMLNLNAPMFTPVMPVGGRATAEIATACALNALDTSPRVPMESSGFEYAVHL